MRISNRDLWTATLAWGGSGTGSGARAYAAAMPNARPEAALLNAIMQMLRVHPKVAWRVRLNSGGFTDSRGQFVGSDLSAVPTFGLR